MIVPFLNLDLADDYYDEEIKSNSDNPKEQIKQIENTINLLTLEIGALKDQKELLEKRTDGSDSRRIGISRVRQ